MLGVGVVVVAAIVCVVAVRTLATLEIVCAIASLNIVVVAASMVVIDRVDAVHRFARRRRSSCGVHITVAHIATTVISVVIGIIT